MAQQVRVLGVGDARSLADPGKGATGPRRVERRPYARCEISPRSPLPTLFWVAGE